MSSAGGPKIITNGLVLAVDAANILSFRGENTTNLMPTITSWGSYVTTPTNVVVYDFPGNISGPKTVKQSIGSSVVGGGGTYGGFYRARVSSLVTSGETATISFWVRSLSGNISCRLSNQNGGGDESNISFSFTATSSWTRVSNSATLNLSKDQFYIWNANTANGILQIADFQLEKKSYATIYTESSRGTTFATGGGWADLTGNENHGELLNGTREGPGYLMLDGSNDYLTIQNSNSLQVGETFTVNSWVYPTNLSNRFGIFSTRFDNAAGSWQLEVGTANAGTGRIAVTGVGTWMWESNSNIITTNTWYNICYVKPNNATQGGSLYLNGVLISPGVTTAYTVLNNSSIKAVGSGTAGGQYFPGNIAQMSLYNRALTTAEVAQNFNAYRGRFGL